MAVRGRRLGIADAARLIETLVPPTAPVVGPMVLARLGVDGTQAALDAKRVVEDGYAMRGRNDADDAWRHAETSRRLSGVLGPEATFVLGGLVEALGYLKGYPRDERIMDFHNNREGRRAFREGRFVNRAALQVSPGPSPTPTEDYPYRR